MRAVLLTLTLFLACTKPKPAATTEAPLAAAPKGDVVRFIAVGDTGKGNDGQKRVARAMAKVCAEQGCNFVMLLGDNIYPSGVSSPDDEQFKTLFEDMYADVKAPFYVVLGNHDYGGRGMGNEFEKGGFEVDYSLKHDRWRMPANHYRFTHGPADFFAADTTLSYFGRDDEVRADFVKWLPNAQQRWAIAFAHHPYFSNGPHGNVGSYDGAPKGTPYVSGDGVKSFLDGYVCGRADVYLSGHDHSRQWLKEQCAGTELIISGAGATGTSINGPNETHYQSDGLGFLYVVVDANQFTASFYDAEGTVNFTRSLTKTLGRQH